MQIEHKLKIYSNEAYLVVKKITVGKKRLTLFDAAIRKVSILLSLAKKEQIYPLYKLYEIKQKLDELQKEVETAIDKIEQQLSVKGIIRDQNTFIIKDEITVKFGNPLIYQLTKLLEQFDRLICLLALGKNTGIFLSKRLYFTEKDKYQQILFRFLSSIVQYPVKELSTININTYVNELNINKDNIKEIKINLPGDFHAISNLDNVFYSKRGD
ncbi:MAG: hypothetical protein ACK4PR_14065 [Gammaproteobacteria bacterium]